MALTHVRGKNKGDTVLYALSTCPWCHKTKQLLNQLGIDYYFVDVDQASGAELGEFEKTIRKWNPNMSFPTLVLGDKKCIIGFREQDIREALK